MDILEIIFCFLWNYIKTNVKVQKFTGPRPVNLAASLKKQLNCFITNDTIKN